MWKPKTVAKLSIATTLVSEELSSVETGKSERSIKKKMMVSEELSSVETSILTS